MLPSSRTFRARPEDLDLLREMPVLGERDHLNHAGLAPLSGRAAAAVAHYARVAAAGAWSDQEWDAAAEETRAAAARLIGAEADEIAYVKNTSEALSHVANGLAWRDGDEIVTVAGEYPANVYPWVEVARRFGVRIVTVPEDDSALLDAIGARTRLVTLSHVAYGSGFRHDLPAIGAFCRERGVLLCVDAIQSVGVLPVDVKAMQIDFLAADGHKWLLSAEGCGIFYCRRELAPRLRVAEIGWRNVVGADDYDRIDFTLREDARRFECGSYAMAGVMALGASLSLLRDAGSDAIAARVRELTDLLIALAAEKGYLCASRRDGERWSGIVSLVAPDAATVARRFGAAGFVVAVRQGRLRIAPHFYNSSDQIVRLASALPPIP